MVDTKNFGSVAFQNSVGQDQCAFDDVNTLVDVLFPKFELERGVLHVFMVI
jgi:hypothetical protein